MTPSVQSDQALPIHPRIMAACLISAILTEITQDRSPDHLTTFSPSEQKICLSKGFIEQFWPREKTSQKDKNGGKKVYSALLY
jgi:hypothetical protein